MGQDQALERLYFMKHYKQWNFSQYSTIYYEFYFFFFIISTTNSELC